MEKSNQLSQLPHRNSPTWIWSAPYVLSSRGKLGDVAAALAVTKWRERRRDAGRREGKGGMDADADDDAVAAIDECLVACLPTVLLALLLLALLARQAAASERIAAATTRREAGRASSLRARGRRKRRTLERKEKRKTRENAKTEFHFPPPSKEKNSGV